jgi:hypothetical protein
MGQLTVATPREIEIFEVLALQLSIVDSRSLNLD